MSQRHLNTSDVFAVPHGMRWEQNQERSAVHSHTPLRPRLHFTQDSGVEECSLFIICKNIIFSSPFSSTFSVKTKALSDPALFPQLPCCFKDADTWPLMQSLAGAAGTFLGLGRCSTCSHQVHHRGMMLRLAEEGGGEWHKRLLSWGCSNSSCGMKLAHCYRTVGSSMKIIATFSQTKACLPIICSSTQIMFSSWAIPLGLFHRPFTES